LDLFIVLSYENIKEANRNNTISTIKGQIVFFFTLSSVVVAVVS